MGREESGHMLVRCGANLSLFLNFGKKGEREENKSHWLVTSKFSFRSSLTIYVKIWEENIVPLPCSWILCFDNRDIGGLEWDVEESGRATFQVELAVRWGRLGWHG